MSWLIICKYQQLSRVSQPQCPWGIGQNINDKRTLKPVGGENVFIEKPVSGENVFIEMPRSWPLTHIVKSVLHISSAHNKGGGQQFKKAANACINLNFCEACNLNKVSNCFFHEVCKLKSFILLIIGFVDGSIQNYIYTHFRHAFLANENDLKNKKYFLSVYHWFSIWIKQQMFAEELLPAKQKHSLLTNNMNIPYSIFRFVFIFIAIKIIILHS
jgi:hypothetical protein